MAEFLRKAEKVDAFQLDMEGHPPEWVNSLIDTGQLGLIFENHPMGPRFQVYSVFGMVVARPGNWVVRGSKGDISLCTPETFQEYYSPVIQSQDSEE